MTYRTEFPDFDPATMPAIPAGWTDQSWHNDVCPSFTVFDGVRVFIDYADPALREFPEGERFSLHVGDRAAPFCTDDWAKLLEAVSTDPHAICRKWVNRIGVGFHPDTRGKDYTPKMSPEWIKEYDADMELIFARAADPYECGIMAMEDAGLC